MPTVHPYVLQALQVLILATGIYLFLRYLRTTRGSGLMRGLIVTVLVIVIGLLSLVQLLGLEELDYLIKKIAGFVVVILAILFQPELRRGITRLGERSVAGKLLARRRKDMVNEVVQAASAMSGQRVGALIAFERESLLDHYIDHGVKIDGEVNRLLLESIFHSGASLHDGAVIIRSDRVAAAACLFPLTENEAVDRSTGTRHRAALGLTEDTDALALIVSEETGKISLCQRGKMNSDISPNRLEEALRKGLGEEGDDERGDEDRPALLRAARSLFVRDVPRKLTSVALAAGLLFFAHSDITEEVTHRLQVVIDSGEGTSLPGVLSVRLPSEDVLLVAPQAGEYMDLRISGTRGTIARLPRLAGSLVLTEISEVEQTFPLDQVDWSWIDDASVPDVNVRPGSNADDMLLMNHIGRQRINLEPGHVTLDTTLLDPRYMPLRDELEFSPAFVIVTGPEAAMASFDSLEVPFRLTPIRFDPDDAVQWKEIVGIAPELKKLGLTLDGPVTVEIPIIAVERDLGTIEKEIALVCLDPERAGQLERWILPPNYQRARFRILSRGILPAIADDGSTAALEAARPVREFVREHLRVYVDTASLSPGKAHQAVVRWTGLDGWHETLGVQSAGFADETSLDVELIGDAKILLNEREATESDATQNE